MLLQRTMQRARSKNNCPLVSFANVHYGVERASRSQVTVAMSETTASPGSSTPSSPALVRLKSAYCLTVLCGVSPGSQSTGTYPHSGNKGEQDNEKCSC